jgi:LemA protein
MSSSLVFWIAAAVLLFWAVGAYNRLVRLRSEANAAFAVMDTELTRQVALVQACLPAEEVQPASMFDGSSSFWSSLEGATAQFAASLAVARQRPLEPDGIAALGAAQDVLTMAWERAVRDDAHDLAGSRLPESVSVTRGHLVAQAAAAAENFNLAVERYNAAIAQFPALLLASLFGFKPGLALTVSA